METTLPIVLPVFGLILLGYLVGRTRLLSEEGVRGLTNFVFYVAMPVFLFRATATLEWPEDVDLSILLAYFGAAAVMFAAAAAIGRFVFGHDLQFQGFLAMGATFSNSVLVGVPLTVTAFGERAILPLMLVVGFHPLILMALPTILIETHRGRGGAWHKLVRTVLTALLKNPIILGMVSGLIYGRLGLPIAGVADEFISLLAKAGPPTALFAVGAGLTAYKIGGDTREVLLATALKLIALPALVWLSCDLVFGLDPLWTAVAVTVAATPIGVNVFVFANTYQVYMARAAAMVLISTAVAWLTVAALLALLLPTVGT